MPRINSRSKGIRGERQVIDALQPVVTRCFFSAGKEAPILQRNTLQCDGNTRGRNGMIGTAEGGKSPGNSDIAGLEFLAIEVKNCAVLSLNDWWKQCERQAKDNHRQQTPVLIYKAKRGVFRVRMMAAIGYSETETRCLVDVSFDDFLRWFEARLLKHIAESADLKPVPRVAMKPPLPVNWRASQ